MNYQEVVQWLFNQVPNFQQKGAEAYKPGLGMIERLLESIDNPQRKIKTIHVAGTNGKGSVSHILSAVLQEHGYKVGLFTSPHIKDFRERLKINGAPISESFVLDFIEKTKEFIDLESPSFFEITTAMAFDVFESEKCDISIIETGLGGRLDSTNVVFPEVSIITNIGLDHTDFLGNSLEKIAFEKAGIIKEETSVVIGDVKDELKSLFKTRAEELNSPIYFTADDESVTYETDLLGTYQQRNIATAVKALHILREGWDLKYETLVLALNKVKSLSSFSGRLDLIQDDPRIIFDAGHNADGIKNLMYEVGQMKFDKLHVVYGASNDKDLDEIGQYFPKEGNYFFTEFMSKRSALSSELEKIGKNNNLVFKTYTSPEVAFQHCKSEASVDDLILVCGSFYLMEKII